LTPLHHELTDVLLEANLRHGYHSGVKEHTHVAFDLPPSQQIDTSLFVVYYHRWGNHLTLFDSRKSASDLPQEELCSEGIHRLLKVLEGFYLKLEMLQLLKVSDEFCLKLEALLKR